MVPVFPSVLDCQASSVVFLDTPSAVPNTHRLRPVQWAFPPYATMLISVSCVSVELSIDQNGHVYMGLLVKDIRTDRYVLMDCHSRITIYHPTCKKTNKWKVPPRFLGDGTLPALRARLETYLAGTTDALGRRQLEVQRLPWFNGTRDDEEDWTVVCDLWQGGNLYSHLDPMKRMVLDARFWH